MAENAEGEHVQDRAEGASGCLLLFLYQCLVCLLAAVAWLLFIFLFIESFRLSPNLLHIQLILFQLFGELDQLIAFRC